MIEKLLKILGRIRADGLVRKGVLAAFQSVIQTISLFLAYRILVGEVGLSQMGILSLMMAFVGFARIADISGMSALSRFAAMEGRAGSTEGLRTLFDTTILTGLAINALLVASIFSLAGYVLPRVMGEVDLVTATELVPWVSGLFFLLATAGGITAGLDGVHRADHRAILVSASALFFLAISVVAIKKMGLQGFVLAQILQQIFLIVVGWVLLKRHVPGLAWIPQRWDYAIFRSTIGFALKLNATGIMTMLFEPLTRFLLYRVSGSTAVASYEVASRVVVQIRALVVASATPMLPSMAAAQGANYLVLHQMIDKSTMIVRIAAVVLLALSLLGTPVASIVVLGHLDSNILAMNALISGAWAINLLSLPLYMAGQAFGIMRWNFVGHTVIAICVLLSGLFLGGAHGSFNVIFGVAVGLVLAAAIIYFGNTRAIGRQIGLRGKLAKDGIVFLLIGTISIAEYFIIILFHVQTK